MPSAVASLGACLAATALLSLGCGHPSGARGDSASSPRVADASLSAKERARRDCRISFALCAPPANFGSDTVVEELSLRNLVQVSSRLDLPDELSERAARRLRTIAETGDQEAVREIAESAEAASSTLGRCRCEGDRFRPEFEKQGIAEVIAARLPPEELRKPGYWAARIDAQLGTIRALSRRSAELLAAGDGAGRAEVDAQIRKVEQDLCETVHAAVGVLQEPALESMRALVLQSRARASGEASVDLARRLLERAERSPSCAATTSGGAAQ
jgi:hypothetical protein